MREVLSFWDFEKGLGGARESGGLRLGKEIGRRRSTPTVPGRKPSLSERSGCFRCLRICEKARRERKRWTTPSPLDDSVPEKRSGARENFDDSHPGEQRKPRGRRSRCGAGMEKTLAVAHAGEERAQPLRSIRSGSGDPRPLRRRSGRPRSRPCPCCWRCPS